MDIQFQNQFSIVRHGKAENNELQIESCKFETQKEYGLTKEGKEVVSKEVQDYNNFDFIYSSPFRRTQETASLFADTSNCEVILDDRLKEFDVGDFDLKSCDISSPFRKQHKDPDFVYPNGESLSDVLNRLIKFMKDINAKHENKKILIVSHGVPCEILIHLAKGAPIRKWEKCVAKGKVFSLDQAS